MEMSELNSSSELRLKVLKGLSLGVGGLAVLVAIGNVLVSQSYIYASFVMLYALYSWHVYRQTAKTTIFNGHKYIMSASLTLLVIVGTFLKPTASGVFFWTLVFPIIYYLLLGNKAGFIATVCLFVVQMSNIAFQFYAEQYFDMLTMMLNFSFCYVTIAIVSHVYEINRVLAENKLSKLATCDPLTGANNRLALKHRYQALQDQQTAFHLLVLDIDHFKAVNDEYGHDGGDVVLKAVVNTMVDAAGSDNVFRQGGEEFCILLENVTRHDALAVAERIRKEIEHSPVVYQQRAIPVTVSIGITQSEASKGVQDINRQADANLYAAKAGGRNKVVASNG
ncbi:GGDEF domain-containing protein [Salinivibrio costicola]|uniref:diguanylate cyclase n=2 Tax=Salinivibrio costicola TaxID=51367 RepID=A0ABX6KBD3_SALCS|nr:GGDEF domain-containing protein [Salinivibrio costicola]